MTDQRGDSRGTAITQETDFRPINGRDVDASITQNGTSTPAQSQYSTFPQDSPQPHVPAPAANAKNGRVLAPDLLRGLLMILMALDHNVMTLNSWPHGTNGDSEGDSVPVATWNRPLAYTIRSLTHLCAPGFTFLLGLGVVYFSRSRTGLGWSRARMAQHFALRAAVLTLISVVFGLAMTMGQVWLLNIVLVALAVDYFLVGLLWLGISVSEPKLAEALTTSMPDYIAPSEGGEAAPLLREHHGHVHIATSHVPSRRATSVSWYVHNAALLGLVIVTIWWNIWLSPTGGHCVPGGPPEPHMGVFWRFWFYAVFKKSFPGVISGFPPLAWVSFAILGLLYGRVVVARPLSRSATATVNAVTGLLFAVIFVMTRLLRFGNLSEGCIQTSEAANALSNPYLTSLEAFFYVVKYPPDVAFFAYTLAGNFLMLAFFTTVPAAWATKWLRPLLVFGTSALFFYLAHLIILFTINVPLVQWLGHEMGYTDPFTGQPAVGVDNLWVFFSVWLAVLSLLYFLCQRYSAFKSTKGPDSLWRFF